ncbi:uncharacterized protein C8R40DRAFT_1265762 [Lentinula edodes]|uniref:uncharacterized protein n=1 Tax=Lentinula edodes TaxID=5353 RepID=UPI001E8D7F5B|nr:uncharacterized protein C8R40DRAFT_1265762 [Lentinula edodes]KAH7874444.1 hypothetical protein C8R40DRAFT_1265762 [Lentinula edodes]
MANTCVIRSSKDHHKIAHFGTFNESELRIREFPPMKLPCWPDDIKLRPYRYTLVYMLIFHSLPPWTPTSHCAMKRSKSRTNAILYKIIIWKDGFVREGKGREGKEELSSSLDPPSVTNTVELSVSRLRLSGCMECEKFRRRERKIIGVRGPECYLLRQTPDRVQMRIEASNQHFKGPMLFLEHGIFNCPVLKPKTSTNDPACVGLFLFYLGLHLLIVFIEGRAAGLGGGVNYFDDLGRSRNRRSFKDEISEDTRTNSIQFQPLGWKEEVGPQTDFMYTALSNMSALRKILGKGNLSNSSTLYSLTSTSNASLMLPSFYVLIIAKWGYLLQPGSKDCAGPLVSNLYGTLETRTGPISSAFYTAIGMIVLPFKLLDICDNPRLMQRFS